MSIHTQHNYDGWLQDNASSQSFIRRNDLSFVKTMTDHTNADVSVADTISVMRMIVNESTTHPIIAYVATQIIQESSPADIVHKLSCIFSYVHRHVDFVQDEAVVEMGSQGSELLIRPEVLLTMPNPQGDCDDFSMLTVTLLLATGVDRRMIRFVTIAANEQIPDQFTHVFVKVYYYDRNGELKWEYMDCSHGLYCGWKAKRYFKIKEWEV